ncbi:MAG: MMPL family transporter, partial [Planctomycetia bacterium]|nr:MMPL family transporter [Planctomycetia bacterium]
MFGWLGAFISRHWGPIVLAWVTLAFALHALAPRWDQVTHDGDLAYLPENLPSTEGERLLAQAFPEQRAKSQIAIVVERPGTRLTMADMLWSDSLADRFRDRQADLPIADVWNRNSEVVGERLTSRIGPNGQATVTLVHVKNEFMATGNMSLLTEVQHILDEARFMAPAGLQVGITGS